MSCASPVDDRVTFDAEGECPNSCQTDEECNVAMGECCLGAPSGMCSSAMACASVCPSGASLQGDPPLCTCDMGMQWNADFTACIATGIGSSSGGGTGGSTGGGGTAGSGTGS